VIFTKDLKRLVNRRGSVMSKGVDALLPGRHVKAGGFISSFEDHRRRAADCLCLAQEVSDPTNKTLLLEMAQTWISLAEQELVKSNKDQK
jgi:hypothetical protein